MTKAFPFPKLEFGSSGSILLWAGAKGQPLMQIFDDVALTVEEEDSQLKLSTLVRDRFGRAVAEITKNEWKTNPHNSFDRNYSKHAIEVKDASGDIVLQVRLLRDRVQLQAKFYDATGRGVAFGMGRDPEGRLGGIMEFTGTLRPLLAMRMQPIFKYPSDRYLGQFVDAKLQKKRLKTLK